MIKDVINHKQAATVLREIAVHVCHGRQMSLTRCRACEFQVPRARVSIRPEHSVSALHEIQIDSQQFGLCRLPPAATVGCRAARFDRPVSGSPICSPTTRFRPEAVVAICQEEPVKLGPEANGRSTAGLESVQIRSTQRPRIEACPHQSLTPVTRTPGTSPSPSGRWFGLPDGSFVRRQIRGQWKI